MFTYAKQTAETSLLDAEYSWLCVYISGNIMINQAELALRSYHKIFYSYYNLLFFQMMLTIKIPYIIFDWMYKNNLKNVDGIF